MIINLHMPAIMRIRPEISLASVKTTFLYVVSLGIIFLCLFVGTEIERLCHAPIPGSIIGMILMFILMVTGILKIEWVRPGATLFLKIMVFLFLPVSVGLMDHFDLILSNALPILVSLIGGTFMVLTILSLALEHIMKKGA